MKKIDLINKLKDSPFTDKVINMWVETLQDDNNCSQFLEAIKLNNKQWESYKQQGITVNEYNDSVIKHYTTVQELPLTLVMPILIGSCDEISNSFIAKQFEKTLVHIKL